MPADRYTAAEVAGLRRELADWYSSPAGIQSYYQALLLGQQQIRPPGPPARVAVQLAAAEGHRLRDGDLWYVDGDLCAVLASARSGMPAYAPRPSDLPSPFGFAVFQTPIVTYPAEITRRDDVVEMVARSGGGNMVREVANRFYREQVSIVAASWGPATDPGWPADGLWMSFYAASRVHSSDVIDEELARQARAILPPVTVDNEAVIAWRPDGAPEDAYRLPAGDAPDMGTLSWARLLFGVFEFAGCDLVEVAEQRTARAERRRTERAELPARDVRVIRLRRVPDSVDDPR